MKIVTRGLLAFVLSCAACGGGGEEQAAEPSEVEHDEAGGDVAQDELPAPAVSERETLTPEDCEARGGEVVGDIGDGAIHQPDYVCPSGQPPMGDIPLGVEGSVCCPP